MRELTRAPALSPHRSFCHQTWQHGGSVVKGKNKVWSGTSFSESGRVHVLNCPKLAPAELQMNWGPCRLGDGGEGGGARGDWGGPARNITNLSLSRATKSMPSKFRVPSP